ncbi:hypothetical protein GCM10009092_24520 [Bowmanella denitrificans]|uniref:Uncharacterized protein n=1 Tax=Bowmanella denitrificans TaxID=366582 RepID=A0ABN0XAT3_9ALTE|nr:hypothetical protein [Bowmanella denitrificans]
MFNKVKLTAAALLMTASMGASAQTTDVSFQEFVSHMLSTAMSTASQEMHSNLNEAVSHALNNLIQENDVAESVQLVERSQKVEQDKNKQAE